METLLPLPPSDDEPDANRKRVFESTQEATPSRSQVKLARWVGESTRPLNSISNGGWWLFHRVSQERTTSAGIMSAILLATSPMAEYVRQSFNNRLRVVWGLASETMNSLESVL